MLNLSASEACDRAARWFRFIVAVQSGNPLSRHGPARRSGGDEALGTCSRPDPVAFSPTRSPRGSGADAFRSSAFIRASLGQGFVAISTTPHAEAGFRHLLSEHPAVIGRSSFRRRHSMVYVSIAIVGRGHGISCALHARRQLILRPVANHGAPCARYRVRRSACWRSCSAVLRGWAAPI